MTRRLLTALLIPSVAACLSQAVGAKPASETYGFEHFEIDVPEPKGWWGVAEHDQAKERIVFSRRSFELPWGNTTQVASLGVERCVSPLELASLGEPEFIRRFWVSLEKVMTREAASRGREVREIENARIDIAGRTFESLTFVARERRDFDDATYYDTRMFIWFAPDFASRGIAYCFQLAIESRFGPPTDPEALRLMSGFIEGFRLVGTSPGTESTLVAPRR